MREAITALDSENTALATYAVTSVVEHETAADIGDLSPESLEEDEEFGGDEAVMTTGYLDVLARLADDIDIQLGRIVIWIGHGDEAVEVEFDDESTVVADRIIVTAILPAMCGFGGRLCARSDRLCAWNGFAGSSQGGG